MAVFGAEIWLARGELFTVYPDAQPLRPLETYVADADWACSAQRCGHGDHERIGCPACFRAPRGTDAVCAGAATRRHQARADAGGRGASVALLATVVFDGFSRTSTYITFVNWLSDRFSLLAEHSTLLRTVVMLGVVAAFSLLFVAVCALLSRFVAGGTLAAARRYAPTLIPIAGVYFVAHYLTYLIIYSQFTWKVLADPLETDWVPDIGVWSHLPSGAVWWAQVGVIVAGHVVAVFEAHRDRSHAEPAAAALGCRPLAADDADDRLHRGRPVGARPVDFRVGLGSGDRRLQALPSDTMIVSDAVEAYLLDSRPAPDPFLAEMEEHGEREGIPIVVPRHRRAAAGADGGGRARRAVEVGTAIGVSTRTWRALPDDGTIVSFEVDEGRHQAARDYLERRSRPSRRPAPAGRRRGIGDARRRQLRHRLPRRPQGRLPAPPELTLPLLRAGGTLVVDNTLLPGTVADGRPAYHWTADAIAAMREFNAALLRRDDLDSVLLPVGDGVIVAVRR
jgi:predicted O-methyltransferase YrrM